MGQVKDVVRATMGRNWKTNLLGVATLLMAAVYAIEMVLGKREVDFAIIGTMITTGWGLIVARDGNQT